MKWLVVGAKGMLGTDLVEVVARAGHQVVAADRDTLDVTRPEESREMFDGIDVVANCAAWTAVDAAEEREGEAFTLNGTAAGLLARECRRVGARLVQISTDYVFAGDADEPYVEDAPVRPVSAYGRTKAAGEWAVRAELEQHLVVRTAWLYGANGACFPKTIARAAAERGRLEVIDDQVGQPTWTMDLADLVLRLVEVDAPAGTYHGTSQGSTSWWGFARAVVESAGMDPQIVAPTKSEAYARPAPRPAYSVLGHDALRRVGVEPIGDWAERWQRAASSVLAG